MAEKVPTYIGFYQPHHPVDWDGLVADPKTGELVKEPSMTKQSFKDECDINNIIKAFSTTGIFTHINERYQQGVFADLPDPVDFQQSLHLVRDAQAAFDSLPSAVRNRFQNDPEQFLAFMQDPANQDEMIRLGLARDTRPSPEPPPSPDEPAK